MGPANRTPVFVVGYSLRPRAPLGAVPGDVEIREPADLMECPAAYTIRSAILVEATGEGRVEPFVDRPRQRGEPALAELLRDWLTAGCSLQERPPCRLIGFSPRRFLDVLATDVVRDSRVWQPLPMAIWRAPVVDFCDLFGAAGLSSKVAEALRRFTFRDARDAAQWQQDVTDWQGPGVKPAVDAKFVHTLGLLYGLCRDEGFDS